ncbi:CRISPR-associated protein Csx11 [Sulfurihydrogenibium subterraneum]|uniref:CRISPR-associated protein Csx11 n=1 Tax=Sulfurihydrogenibium subterraneum TaxID=171121 RepID=UPI00048B4EE4|nr:CRISPR-associated protein Csx11 [Sulfurihydrogenibium subterraneum]
MSGLDRIKNNKDEILKAEIGALLFNLGKTHIGFWKEKDKIPHFSVDENCFKSTFGFKVFNSYEDYHENQTEINKTPFEHEIEKYHLDNFIKNTKVIFPFIVRKDENNKDTKEVNWVEFFKGNASKKEFIKKIFFRGCENINSGIDKGAPNIQLKPPLWLSNAFGSFKKQIEEKDFDIRRQTFFQNFYDFLSKNTYLNNPDWAKIRNFIISEIKIWYSNLLSDSRFPINDVSLWDQAYMTASMFKAVLSQLVMETSLQNINTHNYFINPSSIKWRILGIQYDKLGLAEKGFKLASIEWYRERAKEIDNEIKELLEVEYPIGNEIYRDETGIYFIVGENIGQDGSNDLASLKPDLNDIEKRIVEIFNRKLEGEVYPAIVLTKASRGLMNLGYLLEEAKKNFLKLKINDDITKDITKTLMQNINNTSNAIGICPLCKIRLIYEEDKSIKSSQTVCDVCSERVYNTQVKNWIQNLDSETIWVGEIKDKNDRIALVSLKFELKDWLNGNMLNSLLINQANWSLVLSDLANDLQNQNNRQKKLENTVIKDYVDKSLRNRITLEDFIKSILLERTIGNEWEKFIISNLSNKNLIDFGNRTIDWQNLTDKDIEFLATLLLQFLLRKNPSPARLRRIWETTQEFFENIKKQVLDENRLDIPEWRRKRLAFQADLQKLDKSRELIDEKGLLYWAEKNENKIYLISSIEDFLDAYNLDSYNNKKLLKELKNSKTNSEKTEEINSQLNQIVESLKNNTNPININFYTYNEKENKKDESLEEINIKSIEIVSYKPYASITDPTPAGWQVIIPAEYVPKFIDLVIQEYNKEFKYVYGKLPIHIGIIIQDYKKPLYIGLSALRKIRRDVKNIDKLYQKIDKFCLKYHTKVSNYSKPEEFCNSTQKYYSLYWENQQNIDYNFYIKPDENWKKWISDVDKFINDKNIQAIPNTFDFEFLDTNTRRNDIFYLEKENYKRAFQLKSNRPYEIEEYWDKFKKFKEIFQDKTNTAKLHKLITIFYDKVQHYDKDINPLLASAIINILELGKNKNLQKDIRFIFDLEENKDIHTELVGKLSIEKIKLFLDMFEFWSKALKEV